MTEFATYPHPTSDDYLLDLIAPLRDQDAGLNAETALAAFTRAAWTGVSEPGDRHAGAVIAALGPEAIFALTAGAEREVLERIEAAGLVEVASDPSEWRAALDRWRPRHDLERAAQDCRNAAKLGLRLLIPGDADWPEQLGDLGDRAPHALWVRGKVAAIGACAQSVALVGARACTDYGQRVTGDLAAGAVDRGFAIVSGGAYGVDAMAHRAALASAGATVAVCAGGVDRLYPSGNHELFMRLIERGAMISELPVGQAPQRWRFVQRNRLIAALSQVTVVVEAGQRSGALHTARDALEIGRGVGAVPGPVTSAASMGCHDLLRGGLAELITSPDELAQLWREHTAPAGWAGGEEITMPLFTLAARPSDHAVRVRDALGVRSWRGVDELAARAGLTASQVRAALTELDLAGEAVESAGRWRRS